MDSQLQLQTPPTNFLTTLLGLRDYYAPLVEKYEKLYTQALDNLNHVEALLANWSSTSIVDKQSSTDQGLTTAVETSDSAEITATEAKFVESLEVSLEPSPALEQNNAVQLVISDADNQTLEELSPTDGDRLITTVELTAPTDIELEIDDSDDLSTSTDVELTTTTSEESLYWTDIPMLSQYQSLRRIEAVEKLLQKHIGSVCHVDFVVNSLYGELEPEVFKVVKGRVQSTLTQGKKSNKWSLVPGKPGYYTIDLKLLNSSRKGNSSKQSQKNISSPPAKNHTVSMLAEFEGQFLIDAITSLLEKHQGEVFSVAEVITGLYGELNAQEIKEVKDKVLKELSRGYRTGRFSRVPEKIGLYTWDSRLITV